MLFLKMDVIMNMLQEYFVFMAEIPVGHVVA